MVQQILNFISIPYVGVIIGVILSLVFGIIPFFQSRKMKPKHITKFNSIINNNETSYNDLEFRFKGKVIQTFSETKIYFWNSGNGSIRNFNFLKDDPFGIKIANGVSLYKFQFVTTDKMKKTFNVSYDSMENLFFIDFDAMLKNEGFFINIWHSGDNKESIKVTGNFDGANVTGVTESTSRSDYTTGLSSSLIRIPKGDIRKSQTEPRVGSLADAIFTGVFMLISFLYLLIGVYLLFPNIITTTWINPIYQVARYIFGPMLVLFFPFMMISLFILSKDDIIPSKLEKAINQSECYINYALYSSENQ